MTDTNVQTEELSLLPEDNFDFDEAERVDDGVVLKRTDNQITQIFQKPDNLPAEFWDEEKGTYKSDSILSALEHEKQRVSTLRNKLSKGFQNVPETADHYVLDGFDSEDISEEDAESLQRFKNIAHKNGLSQEQFNSLLSDFKEAFPYNTEDPVSNEERVQAMYNQEMEKLGEHAQQYIENLRSWGRSMVMSKAISKEDYKTLTNMAITADEVRLLDKLRGVSGFISDIPIVESVGDLADEAEIQRIMADPKYDTDTILQRRVETYYKNKYRD